MSRFTRSAVSFFQQAAKHRYARPLATVALTLLAVILMFQYGCSKATDPWEEVEGGQLKVLVSVPPLYCFTKGVAGGDAKVLSLLASTGPHEHQATADDAQVAAGADLFLVNGLMLDDFVTTVASTSGNKKLKVVKVAEKALPAKVGPRLKMAADHDHPPGGDHDHVHKGEWDPHAWLGTEQAILMVTEICNTLKAADSAHGADYDKRAAAYIAKLKDLHKEGKAKLAGKTSRAIVATHESLAYFCKAFDLNLVGSIMANAGVEPDPVQLAALEGICQEHGVRVIAIEPQYRRDKAEALQRALLRKGYPTEIVEIDPMETAPRDRLVDGDYYFHVMRRNLDNLAAKLP